MNNLEKIKAAWAMGWSATVKTRDGEGQVIRLTKSETLVIRPNYEGAVELWEAYQLVIKGYLYAGQLAGNEAIPEGQRFRVRETGEIAKVTSYRSEAICLNLELGDLYFSKEKLEPVF